MGILPGKILTARPHYPSPQLTTVVSISRTVHEYRLVFISEAIKSEARPIPVKQHGHCPLAGTQFPSR